MLTSKAISAPSGEVERCESVQDAERTVPEPVQLWALEPELKTSLFNDPNT
jgi:hypothetical protein